MPYACPVCGAPQADGEHLANHLAFSALLGRADHGDWLDEHAPGWDEDGPEELADRVRPHAESVELDVEAGDGDLPDPGPGVHGGHGTPGHRPHGGTPGPGRERLDPETRRIVEEARQLTERRRAGADEDGGAGADEDTEPTDDEADEKA